MIVSKPILYSLAVVCVAALVFYFQDDAPVTKARAVNHTSQKRISQNVAVFPPEDFQVRFSRAKLPVRNLFAAPVPPPKIASLNIKGDIFKVPPVIAGGDGNWIFTGIAVLDGKKMALLENSGSHQAQYVTEGSPWKDATVRRISAEGVAFVPKAGGEELVVLRYSAAAQVPPSGPGGPVLPPSQAFQPATPPGISGPIGNGPLIMHRMMRGGAGIVIQSGTP